MRLAALLWAGVVLAACTVEVEGAPCTVPGATADCPRDQACGNDLRCSARALACAGSRCTPGQGDACLDPAGAVSGTALARWCAGADPVCGTWIVDRCADRGHACGTRSGAARCECPPTATRELVLRPDGARRAALPFATGAAEPPGCAFSSLGDALEATRDLRAADPTARVTVTAMGATSGATVSFHAPKSVYVRRGVTLRADRSAGGEYEIVLDDPAYSMLVRDGGELLGFTVRASAGAFNAIELNPMTPGAGIIRLSGVTVIGPGGAGVQGASGIHATSADVVLEEVVVRDFPGTGILVDAEPGATTVVALQGGAVTGCTGDGIVANGGALLLDRVRVGGNAGRGVAVVSGVASEIRDSRIVRNGDTGLVLPGPAAIRVVRSTVWGNAAATAWGGTPSGITRRAGGVVLSGTPPASGTFEFWGNRLYGNAGDQVLLLGPASATWSLDQPGTCIGADGPVTNQIGCYDPVPAGTTGASRGIVAVDANASAVNQWWGSSGPSESDTIRLPLGAIPVTTSCLWAAPGLVCSSEDPPPR